MIFVDANVFLRAIIDSPLPDAQRMSRIARDLFRRVEREEVEITTSDAVIAEVAFILTAKAHYHLAPSDAADRLVAIVQLKGVRLRDKRVVLLALDLWTAHPKLGFVDSLAAAYAQHSGIELATFDSDFDDIPGITCWRPDQDGANGHWDD